MRNKFIKMRRRFVILPLISVLFLIFASCRQKYITSDGFAWATTYHIVYSSAVDLSDSIEAEIAAIDSSLSMFNPLSEVSAVNDGITDRVGWRFAEVFEISKDVWKHSGGVYDPTIGPVVELWGFGRSEGCVPDDSTVASVLRCVGMDGCAVSGGVVVKKAPETRFDFSSVAKGYGVDCIADMLERNGVDNYMVEIGGEIAARGVNPSGRQWHIQIDSPSGGMSHERLVVLPVGPDRSAVASSGNYRNIRVDSLGRSYGHTLSPLTGYPAETSVLAVTMLHQSCAFADALATAAMASGCADSALAIAVRAGARALVVEASGDTIRMVHTDGF